MFVSSVMGSHDHKMMEPFTRTLFAEFEEIF